MREKIKTLLRLVKENNLKLDIATDEICSLFNVSESSCKMTINVTKNNNGDIEVKDKNGVRIHLLNEKDNLGLWTYFDFYITSYSR